MEHTRYIKFDFHDNDFGLSAIDAIQTLFISHLFEVAPSWKEDYVIEDGLDFNTRTGLACVQNNRHFIGIEISDKYVQIAKERCGIND